MKHYPQNTNTVTSSFEVTAIFFQKEILVTCNQDVCNKPYLLKNCYHVITFTLLLPSLYQLQKSAFNPSEWKIPFLHILKLYRETPILKHRRQMPLSPPLPFNFFQKILQTLGTQGKQKELTFLWLSQLPCQSPVRTTEPQSVRAEKSPSFPVFSICSQKNELVKLHTREGQIKAEICKLKSSTFVSLPLKSN